MESFGKKLGIELAVCNGMNNGPSRSFVTAIENFPYLLGGTFTNAFVHNEPPTQRQIDTDRRKRKKEKEREREREGERV